MRERAQRKATLIILIFFFAAIFFAATAVAYEKSAAFDYAEDVFEVRSSEDLAEISAMVSSANDFTGKTVLLLSDVVAPSGTVFSYFNGNFKGNGFKIDGLTSSLFGVFGADGKAENFTLTGINSSSWALFSECSGVIEDVALYGAVRNSAVAGTNRGTLRNISAFMTSTAAQAAFVVINSGTVDNCLFSGDVSFTSSTGRGLFIGASSSGSVTDSSFNGKVSFAQGEGTAVCYPFGAYSDAERCSAVIDFGTSDVTCEIEADYEIGEDLTEKRGSAKNFFILDKNGYAVYGEDGTAGTDISALGVGFVKPENGIPFNARLFDGKSGTAGDEFEISDMNDVNKLVFVAQNEDSDGAGFVARLACDVFGNGYAECVGTPAIGKVVGTLSANGHIFAKTAFNPFENATVTNGAPVESGYGSDGFVSGENKMTAAVAPQGSGTKDDPYRVCDGETLAGLLSDAEKNAAGKYAVAVKDIIVNNSISGDKYILESATVNLTLDFLGNALVNAYSAPFETINGSVKNLNLILSSHGTTDCGLCRTVSESGEINGVRTEDGRNATFESGIAEISYGNITRSHNGLTAGYAFCEENYGNVTECSSVAANAFAGGTGTVEFCVSEGKHIDGEGIQGAGSGYFILEEKGFDLLNAFGYEVGKSETAPTVRTKGVSYRTRVDVSGLFNDLKSLGFDTLTYVRAGVAKTDIQGDVLKDYDVNVDFAWTYNGLPHEGEYVDNVGVYELFATVAGETYITETVSIGEITVVQADYDKGIKFDTFKDIGEEYTGAEIVNEPVPTNIEQLNLDGITLNYTISRLGETEECAAFNSGTYIQTLTATSLNYKTITMTRRINVTKKTLSVTVNDREITFGEEVDFTAFGENVLTASGAVGADENKTVKEIIEESGNVFYSKFTTNYVSGGDVGEYTLGYKLLETENYVLSVSGGSLKVLPAVMDGCEMKSETFVYDGKEKSLSVEGEPAGAAVTYENNGHKEAGSYVVTATVTHKNYVTLTLEATLKVDKATIILTVSDAEKDYGYIFDRADFTFTHSDTAEGENFDEVTSSVTFEIDDGLREILLTPGTYEVGLTVTGEADNYAFEVVKGTLTIGKAYLTTVYPAEEYSVELIEEYTGGAIDAFIPSGAFGEVTTEITYEIVKSGKIVEEIVEVGYYTVTATVKATDEYADRFFVTVYTKDVTVTLIQTAINFSESSYEFTFDGTDFAAESNFPITTEKIPDDGEITVYYTKDGSRVSEIVHAGRYTVVAEFFGNGNYADARATAAVIVNKKEAVVSVKEEYFYTGTTHVPEAEISYKDGESGNLSTEELVYTYTDRFGATLGSVAEEGTYTLNVSSGNADYSVTPAAFAITIKPLAVVVTVNNLAFEYGARGEYSSDGTAINVGTDRIGVLNYEIAETGATVTFEFRLNGLSSGTGYFPIGKYTISDGLIIQPKNYRFTLSAPFTVEVTKRYLFAAWTLDGTTLQTNAVSIIYAGKDQTERIGYALSGFAAGENENNVTVVKQVRQGTAEAILKGADEYSVFLTLSNSPYYVFNGTPRINVTVTKAPLTSITIGNGEVMRYEELPVPTVTVDGLRGEDIGKSPTSLRGYSFRATSSYNRLTAYVGDVYRVSGEFAFSDYTIASENIVPGRFTVVEGYASYSLPSMRYVYDGTEKTVTVGEVEDGVTVAYVNNAHTDAGTYIVNARITYPTGRTETLSSTLVITKATPIINCFDEYGFFTEEYTMTAERLNATAYLNATVPTVDGTFTFIGSTAVRRGKNTFSVVFTPTARNNLESVTFSKNLTLYEFAANDIEYDSYDFTMDEDGTIYIEKPLKITIDKSRFVGAEEMLSLYYNGSATNEITFNRTANKNVEVRYGTTVVYAATINVVYGSENKPDDSETVKVNHKLLKTEGVTFSSDGATIYLESEKGYISMADEYREEFTLYVDGRIISGTYEITASTKEIIITINSRKLGVSLYTAATAVTTEKPVIPPENNGEINEGESGGFKTYYYYIIAGAGVLVAVGVILLILKLRR